jgi:hypothetical protein
VEHSRQDHVHERGSKLRKKEDVREGLVVASTENAAPRSQGLVFVEIREGTRNKYLEGEEEMEQEYDDDSQDNEDEEDTRRGPQVRTFLMEHGSKNQHVSRRSSTKMYSSKSQQNIFQGAMASL